jgi:hypothetical protein
VRHSQPSAWVPPTLRSSTAPPPVSMSPRTTPHTAKCHHQHPTHAGPAAGGEFRHVGAQPISFATAPPRSSRSARGPACRGYAARSAAGSAEFAPAEIPSAPATAATTRRSCRVTASSSADHRAQHSPPPAHRLTSSTRRRLRGWKRSMSHPSFATAERRRRNPNGSPPGRHPPVR